MINRALVEGVKEILRNSYLAVVPVLYTALQSTIAGNEVNWRLTGIVALASFSLAVLRGIDKWIHESKVKLIGIPGTGMINKAVDKVAKRDR